MVTIVEATEHDEQNAFAEELLERKDYRGAAQETQKVLDELEPHLPTIAQAAVVQGRALMAEAMDIMKESGEPPAKESLEKIFEAYELSQMLNPDCEETGYQLVKASRLLQQLPIPDPPKQITDVLEVNNSGNKNPDFDVIVVGAGAAGVGTALMLTDTFGLQNSRVVLMERGAQVGESFRQWPAEMKFISPSFNQQGWTKSFDLNAISHGTSPAFSLHTEHPSGKDYAAYLEAIAKMNKLNVRTQMEVVNIRDISITVNEDETLGDDEMGDEKQGDDEEENHEEEETTIPLFSVEVQSLSTNVKETLTTRYIVWAAGEFQYPRGAAASYSKSTSTSPSNGVSGSPDSSPERKRKSSKLESSTVGAEEKKSEGDNDNGNEGASKREFPGAEFCMHNSLVRSWATLPGEEYIIIGGYESGVDAAVNLSKAGKKCKVLASTPCWSVKTADPSAELAPYTAARLRDVLAPGFSPQPQLMAPLRVVKVEKVRSNDDDGFRFNVTAQWQAVEEASNEPNLRNLVNHSDVTEPSGEEGSTFVIQTPNPPVLCTGFEGSVAAAASHLFDFADDNGEVHEEEEGEGDNERTDEEGDMDVQMDEDEDNDEKIDSDSNEMESDEKSKHGNHSHSKGGCLAGAPLLTSDDESTKVPGVFLVGPTVSHGSHSFCFVYKFRQRFAIVANAICQGLGRDTRAAVSDCRNANMYLDDLACCEDTCGDVC